jgi:hypothetical protein
VTDWYGFVYLSSQFLSKDCSNINIHQVSALDSAQGDVYQKYMEIEELQRICAKDRETIAELRRSLESVESEQGTN